MWCSVMFSYVMCCVVLFFALCKFCFFFMVYFVCLLCMMCVACTFCIDDMCVLYVLCVLGVVHVFTFDMYACNVCYMCFVCCVSFVMHVLCVCMHVILCVSCILSMFVFFGTAMPCNVMTWNATKVNGIVVQCNVRFAFSTNSLYAKPTGMCAHVFLSIDLNLLQLFSI